jgi:hypothetical protein
MVDRPLTREELLQLGVVVGSGYVAPRPLGRASTECMNRLVEAKCLRQTDDGGWEPTDLGRRISAANVAARAPGQMLWFGEPWGAPLCENCPRASTPAGEECVHCEQAIVEGDQGVIYVNGPAAHRTCFAKNVIGPMG